MQVIPRRHKIRSEKRDSESMKCKCPAKLSLTQDPRDKKKWRITAMDLEHKGHQCNADCLKSMPCMKENPLHTHSSCVVLRSQGCLVKNS